MLQIEVNLTPVAIAEGQVFSDNFFGGMSKVCDYDNVASGLISIEMAKNNELEASNDHAV